MKKTFKTVYEVIDEKYFDESKVRFPKKYYKWQNGIQCYSFHCN